MPEVDNEGFTELAMGSDQRAPQQPMMGGQQQQYSPYQDTSCFAEFFMHPQENKALTLEKGRPIFEEKVYVRIMIPGDKTTEIQRPVRMGNGPNHDNMKYAHQYSIFMQGQGADQALIGTPLKHWPPVTKSMVLELAHYEVRTVEQLAQVSDQILQKFMGLGAMRQKAIDWLANAKDGELVSQLRAELVQRDNKIETLEEGMKELAQAVEELKSAGSGGNKRKSN